MFFHRLFCAGDRCHGLQYAAYARRIDQVLNLMEENRRLTEAAEAFEERLHHETRKAEKRRLSAANRAELEVSQKYQAKPTHFETHKTLHKSNQTTLCKPKFPKPELEVSQKYQAKPTHFETHETIYKSNQTPLCKPKFPKPELEVSLKYHAKPTHSETHKTLYKSNQTTLSKPKFPKPELEVSQKY